MYLNFCNIIKLYSAKCFCGLFRDRVVSKAFMRKYIHIAKALSPVLTQDAANHIAEEYSRLRSQEQLGSDIARVNTSAFTNSTSLGVGLLVRYW